MKNSILSSLFVLPAILLAQPAIDPLISANRDVYAPFGVQPSHAMFHPVFFEKGSDISEEQKQEVIERIAANRKKILAKNPGAFTSKDNSPPLFIKPVRAKEGFDDYGFYTINFLVDHDLATGNNLLDYYCDARTYDWSTGNHQGTDYILWPYPWKRMEQEIMEIVAAAPGVIVDKRDGHFDLRCSIDGNPNWNGIALEHADGSQSWYWHFKDGAITEKEIGETVEAGEYLGAAGSSGASNWPHLHFEVRDPDNNVIDPFAGPCNEMNTESWWVEQHEYFVPMINRLSTHNTTQFDQNCPEIENTYETTWFNTGDNLILRLFYRDIERDARTTVVIRDPGNNTFVSWNWDQSWGLDYATAYAHWELDVTAAWPQGWYTVLVTFGENTYETTFAVGVPTGVSENQMPVTEVFPTRVDNRLTVRSRNIIDRISIYDISGRMVEQHHPSTEESILDLELYRSGMYFLKVNSGSQETHHKIIKN